MGWAEWTKYRGPLHWPAECRGPRVSGKKLCTRVKLLTNLQTWGCELQKMRLSARWRSYSVTPDPLAVIRGKAGKEGEGKGWE